MSNIHAEIGKSLNPNPIFSGSTNLRDCSVRSWPAVVGEVRCLMHTVSRVLMFFNFLWSRQLVGKNKTRINRYFFLHLEAACEIQGSNIQVMSDPWRHVNRRMAAISLVSELCRSLFPLWALLMTSNRHDGIYWNMSHRYRALEVLILQYKSLAKHWVTSSIPMVPSITVVQLSWILRVKQMFILSALLWV